MATRALSFSALTAIATIIATLLACGGSEASPSATTDDGGVDPSSCVFVDVATYDTSCGSDSDCTFINAGQVCPTCGTSCPGGNAVINNSGYARYRSQIAAVPAPPPGSCPTATSGGCASFGVARCVAKTCTYCTFTNPPAGCPATH